MAFAGMSLIVDGKLCDLTSSPFDAGVDSGYHLLVVQGYSNTKGTTPNGSCISSRPFLVGGHRWIVDYYPNGRYEDDVTGKFMSLMLVHDDDVGGHEGVSQGVKVQCEFSFIDEPESQVPAIIRTQKINTACCEMGYTRFIRNEAHFSNLLFEKDGADITFEVGGYKFAAHRIVLAARSTVFKAQLFGAMDEGATAPSVLKINDIEANVFSTLLTFIYTDAVAWFIPLEENEGDKEEMLNLLEAAVRYDLQKLKVICEEKLASRCLLTMASVANIIVVAERRGCRWLKDVCMELIKSRTTVHKVFTAGCLDEIIRTTSPSDLKELFSKYSAS
nr:BTB/POZ and MATH domain-containing protein 5-like [Lolium perenne]